MVMPNPFNNPAFNSISLTGAINILPSMYGRVNELGIFPFSGVATRQIALDYKSGVLTLIPSKELGAPGHLNKSGGRELRSFNIPHFPLDDVILPADVQGRRKFGSENQMESLTDLMNDRLQELRNKHDITLEWLRMGALKGIIYDGDGTTVLYNLFTEFSISQIAVDFKLGTAATIIKDKCMEVNRAVEDNLRGEIKRGIRVLCDADFFDALTGHASVKEAYLNWNAASGYTQDLRKGFPFGGIMFEEYRGTAKDLDDNDRAFIPTKEGIAYPEGTTNTFKTYCAPADFNEAVNTIGVPFYAKQEPKKFDRGTDLHTQSNVLPLCARPEVLIRVHSTT